MPCHKPYVPPDVPMTAGSVPGSYSYPGKKPPESNPENDAPRPSPPIWINCHKYNKCRPKELADADAHPCSSPSDPQDHKCIPPYPRQEYAAPEPDSEHY